MKKTLIALAAFSSIAGMAQAQSSVTLYGIADASLGRSSETERAAGGISRKNTQTSINSGNEATSRFGMRGSEDLGGGLRAVFNLEAGVALDTGAGNTNGGTLFGRAATVGLIGGFGAVILGRQYTAYYDLVGSTNHSDNAVLFSLNNNAQVYSNGVVDYSLRTSNGLRYNSPSFGGFSGAVVVATGEDKGPVAGTTPQQINGSASRNVSFHLKYSNGPLLVGYAYQNERFNAGTTISDITPALAARAVGERDYNLFAASYDFGVAKITGSYQAAKQKNSAVAANNGKDKEFQTGVSVPLGASTVYAGYVRSKSDTTGLKAQGFSLLGTYNLSKRTKLYAGGIAQKYDLAAGAPTGLEKRTAVVAGLRHNF